MTRTLLRLVVPVALVLSATAACSRKHDDARTKKLATLCTQAGDMLAHDSGTADDQSFESILSSALEACSQACDGDDQASCKQLDDHLKKVCHVSSDVCGSLCTTAHSPSLKQTACKLAPHKS